MARGFHLITEYIESALSDMPMVKIGQVHLFIKHTSASLTLNENCDPSVRRDMEAHFLRTVPDSASLYEHDYEGLDDMPAHIKSSLL
ncbi:MAG: secondary thiamine-phosphate synthase enzyme YjbQ, partial [Pseudomonadales bacterium]